MSVAWARQHIPTKTSKKCVPPVLGYISGWLYHHNTKTTFTLDGIFHDSRWIRDVLVPDSFCRLHIGGWIRLKQNDSGLVMSPEILNPKSKVNTLYPNTVESAMFCRANRSCNESGYLSARDSDFFPSFSWYKSTKSFLISSYLL